MQKTLTKLLMVFIAMLTLNTVDAQRSCGHDHHMEQLLQDPDFAREYEERQRKFRNYSIEYGTTSRAQCPNPVTLPMAVHYQGLAAGYDEACLIALAEAQIQILNEDYGGYNADITNWTGSAAAVYPGVNNGETCIAFCLATENHPTGYGLASGDKAVTFNTVSGDSDGNWNGYINIFVRNIGPLGYSPLGGSGNGDGVTIDNNAFGSGAGCSSVSPGAPYNLGRTLTHELGHYLNLDHIWGGGCGVDDGVADTPNQSSDYGGCPTLGSSSSCSSEDLHMNYMDYTNDACMYMFSAGQSTVMENYVAANLQNVANNQAAVCVASTAPPTAAFTASNNGPITICTGASTDITFTDTSSGAPTSWAWTFSGAGVSPTTSTAQNPTVTVSAGGTLTATLTATNANGDSNPAATQSITITEETVCTTFLPSDGASGTVCPGQCIGFFDQSIDNPTSWTWSFTVTGDLTLSLTSSTDQNPTVCIPSGTSGDIVAILTTNSGTATNTISITVDQNCTAGCLEVANYADTYTGAIYGAGQGQEGLLSGNNTYNDIAKADSYDLNADFGICTPSSLTGATLCFAAVDAGVTGAFDVAVWDDNAGVPGTIIASITTDAAAIDTEVNTNGNNCVFYDFSTAPVNLTGKFYVGITGIDNITGGYLGLITNTVGEHTAVTGWEQWEDASWNSYSDVWNEAFTHAIFLEILPGAPTVAINVPAPTGGFCNDGTSYTFSENADLCTAGAGTAEVYMWTVNNGQTSTAASADFAFTTAGSYDVELCVTGVSCETNCVTETITVIDCGGGCNNLENYTGSVVSGTYQAGVNITSSGTVASTETVVFNAGTDIDMTAGFCVEQGADFLAEIVACTPFTGNVTTQRLSTQNMTVTKHSFSVIKGQTFDTKNGRLGKRYINQMKNVIINNMNTGLKKAKK